MWHSETMAVGIKSTVVSVPLLAPASAKVVTHKKLNGLTGIMLIAFTESNVSITELADDNSEWTRQNIINKMCCLCPVVSLCCGVCCLFVGVSLADSTDSKAGKSANEWVQLCQFLV